MKKLLLALSIVGLLGGCSDNEVGDVGLGWFTMKDVCLFTQPLYTLGKF